MYFLPTLSKKKKKNVPIPSVVFSDHHLLRTFFHLVLSELRIQHYNIVELTVILTSAA